MSKLTALKNLFFGDPAKRLYIKLQDAQRTTAMFLSQAEYARRMADFYTARVMSLDPHKAWWEFAEAKEQQITHQLECVRYETKASESNARVEALYAQYEAVTEGEP